MVSSTLCVVRSELSLLCHRLLFRPSRLRQAGECSLPRFAVCGLPALYELFPSPSLPAADLNNLGLLFSSATGTVEDLVLDSEGPSYSFASQSQAGSETPSMLSPERGEHDESHPSTATLAPPVRLDPFADLLKYNVATSFLLTPRLSDALPLYPDLSHKPAEMHVNSDGPRAPTPGEEGLDGQGGRAVLREEETESALSRPKMEWVAGWDTVGEDWRDRSPARNAWELLCHLALAGVALWHFGASEWAKYRSQTPAVDIPPRDPQTSTSTVHATVLGAVDQLVAAAQQLDIRVARALGGIREVECVGWGLGLSVPSRVRS